MSSPLPLVLNTHLNGCVDVLVRPHWCLPAVRGVYGLADDLVQVQAVGPGAAPLLLVETLQVVHRCTGTSGQRGGAG